MITPIPAAIKGHFFSAAAIACALTACAPGLEKKQTPLDTAAVKQIEFKIGKLEPASLKSTMSEQEMTARISENLAGWGYPVGLHGKQAVSHTLNAEIGLIEHSETPTGFSFSAGNSDPRALDFQKTQVLPVSCELVSIAKTEQSAYLHMDFDAGHGRLSTDELVDHISTVCFNLLNELDWPDKTQSQPSSSIKPGWIPEVRIETVDSPAEEEKEEKDEKTEVPAKTVTRNSEGRKQIIIHNQGSPLILKFGHDRR